MAKKLAQVVFLNLTLLFLHFTTSCLGATPMKSSFGQKTSPGGNSPLDKVVHGGIKKLVDKYTPTDESPTGDVPQSDGIYEITFTVGTPPQNVTSIMDISSTFTWTQCSTCDPCFNQTTALYNPEKSTTYSNFSTENCLSTKVNDNSICEYLGLPSSPDCGNNCLYEIEYDVDQTTTGVMATDNFTFFGSTSSPNIFFGCAFENYGDDYYNSSGYLGLGRGPLSVMSQFPFMRFSYCLSSDQRKVSPVNFGSLAKLQGSSGQSSTPLLGSDLYPELYYIGLVNITVGTTPLNIPSSTFELSNKGEGGVFLATIYALTYLEQAAYDLVEQAFSSSMKNQTAVDGTDIGLNLCYKNGTKWPSSITLQFDGGATLKLKKANFVYRDPDTGIECLSIVPSSGISVLGSFIQMDTNFVIDLDNKTISFEKCYSSSSVAINIPHLETIMALFLFCVLKFF